MEPITETKIPADLEQDILRAITVIKAERKANARLIENALKIDRVRAAKIVAALEERGALGPGGQHGVKRKIFFDKLEQAANHFSSALASAVQPEVPRIPPPVPDVPISELSNQDCPPDTLTSADDSLDPTPIHIDETVPFPPFPIPPIEIGKPVPTPIKLCVIAYLPPPRFNTLAFLENLRRNPPAHPLITFSDDHSFEPTVKMKRSIEIPELKEKTHGIANLAFYLAFGQAWKADFTHFLYAEADIRVRNESEHGFVMQWDEVILDQFRMEESCVKNGLTVAGSMMLDNPFRSDPETARRANELLVKWNPNLASKDPKERNKPIVCRAQRGVKDNTSMVGCNGAGAIYSVAGLRELFPEIREHSDTATMVTLAKDGLAFDWEIAKRLWQKHGAGAFDRCAHLPSIFSSFQDHVSTEAERLDMLRSGRCVLVHPVKSEVVE